MKHLPQNPYIERGRIRFVGTRGFFFCFAAATVAAVVAGFLRRGLAILAFPLLAWSPFLLLISLHMASHAFNQSRDPGGPIPRGAPRAQSAWGIACDLVIIAAIGATFFVTGRADLQPNSLLYLPWVLFIILDAASHGLSYAGNRWGSILRRALPPVTWFCMAIGVAGLALWMLFTVRPPHP